MNVLAAITVGFKVEGWHHWPTAPESRGYLRHSHRHLFGVAVTVEVFEDDREIEYHDLLDWARSEFPSGDLGARSCETLARDLLAKAREAYPGRFLRVAVDEDGECAATLTLRPPQPRPPAP